MVAMETAKYTVFFLCLIWLSSTESRRSPHESCPPPCSPPKDFIGCKAYRDYSDCDQKEKDLSMSEASCGCLWQSYIQSVEPRARVIFTNKGNECYVWAASLCAYLENKTKISIVNPLRDILLRVERLEDAGGFMLAREIAKNRKRNGVEMYSHNVEGGKESKPHTSLIQKATISKPVNKSADGTYIGKKKKSKSEGWFEVKKNGQLLVTPVHTAAEKGEKKQVSRIVFIHHHWFDVDMNSEKFKLVVFMIILLLNILVVLVLIFCRSQGKDNSHKEPLHRGDLDPVTYGQDSSNKKDDKPSPFKQFMDKLKYTAADKKTKPTFKFVQMDETRARDFHGSRRGSSTLYDNANQLVNLDNTYEEPLTITPARNEIHPKRYTFQQEGMSEENATSLTKYLPRDIEQDGSKNVTFTLPTGTFVTMQDSVKPYAKAKKSTKGVVGGGRMLAANIK